MTDRHLRWHNEDAADLIGTAEERAALFDYLVSATQRRQAISPAKQRIFALDPARDMGRFRDDLIGARTPAALWYALVKLSNCRHDRHLSVRPVDGGLPMPPALFDTMVFNYAELDAKPAPRAPAVLATDFADASRPRLFLAGIAPEAAVSGVAAGDWLVTVNGEPIDDFIARVEPYFCHSTPAFFWYHLPSEIPRRSCLLPVSFYAPTLNLGLEGLDGAVRTVELQYLVTDQVVLPAVANDPYAGFDRVLSCPSYSLYRLPGEALLLMDWRRFGKTLVADVDALMAYAVDNALLAAGIILDATRCRGGDFGGYLLQRLSPRPIRINFGDLRLSDAIEAVIEQVLAEDREDMAAGGLHADQLAAIGWRRDWLENDVRRDLAAGRGMTPAVPFKCAHQPKTGVGMLPPAMVHFSGPIVCLTMPFGGSHIDQVVAQLADNGLCYQIGMPLGGFSKTYVYDEVLRLPGSGIPLARFMWSCGNTVRPNGEVLEGNPAIPHESIPQTRDNFRHHHRQLVERAVDALRAREKGSIAKEAN